MLATMHGAVVGVLIALTCAPTGAFLHRSLGHVAEPSCRNTLPCTFQQKLQHPGVHGRVDKLSIRSSSHRRSLTCKATSDAKPGTTPLKVENEAGLPFWQRWFRKREQPVPPPVQQREPETIKTQVAVIGAGVAGLVCARNLMKAGLEVAVFEASDGVGGRIRTDKVDGFLLDRGFQVFIEEYPASKAQLDYGGLALQQFAPGALVRCEGGLHLVADPVRRPGDLLAGLSAPVGGLLDKLRVGWYRLGSGGRTVEGVLRAPEVDTLGFLRNNLQLSDGMVDRFFKPFYQGIFLAPLQEQSSRMFEFVFKMFADGAASLPEKGMGAVTQQIADQLPAGCVRLNTPVLSLSKGEGGKGHSLALQGGARVLCSAAVVATDGPAAGRLLSDRQVSVPAGRSSTCLYYGLDSPPPVTQPILVLNGEGQGPVNNVVFLDQVAPSYAPEGKSLASVTVVGDPSASDADLEQQVRAQLREWFGEGASQWRHLRTYRVLYAQPVQTPPNGDSFDKTTEVEEGVFCCGDHRSSATLNGAIESGVRAAAAVTAALAVQQAAV